MKAESAYWKEQFETTNPLKAFWKTVNLYQGKTLKSNIGVIPTFQKLAVNYIQQTLSTITTKSIVLHQLCHLKINQHLFEKAFRDIQIGKASGTDIVKSDYLKAIGPEVSDLYNVIKRSIQQGKFPTQWKVGKVSCLHKKGSKQDPNNYRPTLLSIPSKVLEKIVFTQLNAHLTTHNIICNNQWGFHTGRSTESILLKITEQWNKTLDCGKVVAVVFIDFKKHLTWFHITFF